MATKDSWIKETKGKEKEYNSKVPRRGITMISEPQVHMYMSEKEFNRLRAGETAYGYSEGFTEYNIHVSVPIRFVEAVIDVSEDYNPYYEYYVKYKEGK